MEKFDELKNPFTVTTPEGMSAERTVKLFVDVFSDFPKVPREGHVFLHGPRGSGKSMIFRYLQPDCQCLDKERNLSDLLFYSIYVPIKNTDPKIIELLRLEDKHASTILNEHFMTINIALITFTFLAEHISEYTDDALVEEVKGFAVESFFELLADCGCNSSQFPSFENFSTIQECFQAIADVCEKLFKQFLSYLKKLSFQTEPVPYDGPLCGYFDFLFPLFCELKKLSFMPNGPIYLLIDDADNLNLTQTKILNSWVASRTSSDVSIKVSTQLRYKTFRTVTGHTIDTPHDYSEINISTIYTTHTFKGTYRDWIREIVSRRLNLFFGIDLDPDKFFPVYEKQEKAIKEIAEKYRRDWEHKGRGYRKSDDATRYARPDYMKSLAGTSKSSPSYSYAGFDQLVHISSGIIRHFLQAAADMYSEVEARSSGQPITFIPPHIQNSVIRSQSNAFLFDTFEKMHGDESEEAPDKDLLMKLFNLIRALGGTFRQILLSDRAERRMFSIAFSNAPNENIRKVLSRGEQLGYFHVSAIGNKDGTGRTRLYILSRMLAPHFSLDPTSFAGYLFVTSSSIEEAMHNPYALLRKVKKDGADSVFEEFEERQLKLFD